MVAVDSIDLEVETGEIYGFLGPNGAGKSTAVRMFTTLLSPTGGSATVAGHDVADDAGSVRLRIGVALQDAALDPVSRVRVWDEVRRLNDELGMTIFLTTQYLEEADELADRIGIIDKGRIVAEGTPEALKRTVGSDLIIARVEADPDRAAASLDDIANVDSVEVIGDELMIATDDGAAAVSGVAIALDGCGVAVRELTLRTPTLDDVFLELTGGHLQEGDE